MKRALLAALLATAAVPAAPARAEVHRLHAGPLAVHGYAMTLDAQAFGRTASLDVTFTKRAGTVRQTHEYTFGRHVRLTAPRNLATGRLRATLDGLGRIDLRFHRTGAIHKTKRDPTCGGPKPRRRLGRVTGSLRFAVDKTFFGTVTAHRLAASLTRIPNGVHCTGVAPFESAPPGLELLAGDQQSTQLDVLRLAGGRSRQTFSVTGITPEAIHTLSAVGPAGSFTGDRDAATVTGAAPAFSGSLTYTATSHIFGPVPSTEGTARGDLTANFDSIGPQRVPPDDDASMAGQ
jgi:hypothetical protein